MMERLGEKEFGKFLNVIGIGFYESSDMSAGILNPTILIEYDNITTSGALAQAVDQWLPEPKEE